MAVPEPPTNPTASACTEGCCAQVTWTPSTTASVSYEVLALPTQTLHTEGIRSANGTQSLKIDGLEPDAKYTFQITAVNPDGRSAAAATPPVTIRARRVSSWWLNTSLAFLAAMAVMTVVSGVLWGHGNGQWRSLFLGFVVLLVAAGVLTAVDHEYGVWRPIIGVDKRVSTSQFQTFFWTLLVAFLLAYFTGRAWFDHQSDVFQGMQPGGKKDGGTIWDDYLVLLGGPFAALVAARGIVTAKVQNGVVQKSVADDGSAAIAQAVKNDAGNVDLVDTQYLIFNVVAFVYVLIAFATTDRLPAIPGLLLALTGTSAAAYVLNKSVQSNAPTITSVMPSSARPGERIVISGTNFTAGGAVGVPTVSIGGIQAMVDAAASDSRVTAYVPAGVAAGVQSLVVTSATRVSTDQFQFVVLADKPVVLGVTPPAASAGDDVFIDGTGFLSPRDDVTTVTALFGAVPVAVVVTRGPAGLDRVAATVPATSSAPGVDVRIRTARLTESDPVTLSIQ